MRPGAPETQAATEPDPRRWVTLGVVVAALFIVVVDNSVLNVAIPTILRDFHTTLPSLQWVITGYSLMFASLLVIGGRLGDIYGHRRTFIIGAALFTIGSLLAALSWNVGSLIVGEAVIEGIGASLMMPATLAILSTTFTGRERGHRVRGVGRGRRRGRRVRPGRRRLPHDELLVALVLRDQRDHRAARDRRRAPLHQAGPRRPQADARSTSPARR